MATRTSTKKSKPRAKAGGTAKKATRTTAKKVTSTTAKTVRKAARSPIGKAASKVLAGAAAGAVRAIIPQLEEAADSQEKVAESDRPKERGTKASRSSRS